MGVVAAAMIRTDKFIFVHVPKTGGVSVNSALGGRTLGGALHLPLFQLDKGNRFAFGFIRDPWERMVSLYRFLIVKGRTSSKTFKHWLLTESFFLNEDDPELCLMPLQRRPQMWWLEGCDHIGLFENLATELNLIAISVGIPLQPLHKSNSTQGIPWCLEYDAETYDHVCRNFKPDIAARGERLCRQS